MFFQNTARFTLAAMLFLAVNAALAYYPDFSWMQNSSRNGSSAPYSGLTSLYYYSVCNPGWNEDVVSVNNFKPGQMVCWGPRGNFRIPIKIKRYYGDKEERERQIRLGLIPKKITLEIGACECCRYGHTFLNYAEVDTVQFNGRYLGVLKGRKRTYCPNYFEIPVEYVNFPERLGDTAVNYVNIKVDTLARVPDYHGLGVIYSALVIPAPNPIYLVHGWTDDLSGVESMQKQIRSSLGIPTELAYVEMDLAPEDNAFLMEQELEDLTKLYGVKQFNLLVHSKGGLDSRVLVDSTCHGGNTKVAAVMQIATPNAGSRLADLYIGASEIIDSLPFYESGRVTPAVKALTPDACVEFNAKYHSPICPVSTVIGSMRNYTMFDGVNDDPEHFIDYPWKYQILGKICYGHDFHSKDTKKYGDGIVSVNSAHAIGTQLAASPLLDFGTKDVAHDTIMTAGAPRVLSAFQGRLGKVVGKNTEKKSVNGKKSASNRGGRRDNALEKRSGSGGGAASPPVYPEDAQASPESTMARYAFKVKAGQVNTFNFNIYSADESEVVISGVVPKLKTALTAPDGKAIAVMPMIFGNVDVGPFTALAKMSSAAEIAETQRGAYTLTADAQALSEDLTLAVTVLEETPTLLLHLWKEDGKAGKPPMEIRAYAELYGQVLPDVEMTLVWRPKTSIGSRKEKVERAEIRDDGTNGDAAAGDGVFTALISPPEGAATVTANMTAVLDGIEVVRTEKITVYSTDSDAVVDTEYTEEIAQNMHGFITSYKMNFSGQVDPDCEWFLRADFCDQEGNRICTLGSIANSDRDGKVDFVFDVNVDEVFASNTDGPYQICGLELQKFHRESDSRLPVWTHLEPLQTAKRSFWDFRHVPFILTGNAREELVFPDDNKVSLPTQLKINVDVLCCPKIHDEIIIEADLLDAKGRRVAQCRLENPEFGTLQNDENPKPLELVFEGEHIRSSGQDGPYHLGPIICMMSDFDDNGVGTNFRMVSADIQYTTKSYSCNEFTLLYQEEIYDLLAMGDERGPDENGVYSIRVEYKHDARRKNPTVAERLYDKFGVVIDSEEPGSESQWELIDCEWIEDGSVQFQDHTATALAQLRLSGDGDLNLDDKESVVFEVKYRKQNDEAASPPLKFYALTSTPLKEEFVDADALVFHLVDADCNFDIAFSEVDEGVQSWKQGMLDNLTILQAIYLADFPGYTYDLNSDCFVPL